MGYTSLRRNPKKEEQQVPDTLTDPYAHEEFNILDELHVVLDIEEQQNISPNETSSGKLHWDFMEWEEFSTIGEEAEDDEGKVGVKDKSINNSILKEKEIKRENIFGFCEVNDEKMMALNLNLNYQDVLDAWSDRRSPWADDYSFSMATNNGYYMGEVPILEEERRRREASVLRYKEKRQNRLFSKKIRYQVRKINADKRPRNKGRFVKRH
ncbi:PREDICTED: protein CHLOROPLAST IMPORT APPARATUS 2-like isoform X2 [Lupinus angustifolius]|uniref:protein CHLOROPLAST IMPORT APPARATUS 2-like isoform X2 n=1 Tax=Lupinus angustifolius TaxID=3871 RepID=UPI00092EC4A6|nr:PREDICTED: protein CHLOROPLAST IMPORT APPARATUS 2-like isoform X2 [Lupinus angustifolius]